MITNTLPKEQSIYLILYNIEDADLCKFESLIGSYISDVSALIKQKENVINKVLPSEFSQVQKLLITLYLHLYAALHSRDLFSDKRLANIRKKLDISDGFTKMSFQSMKQLNPNSILTGRTPIESIIEPANEVIIWSKNVVYQALCDGRYITDVHPKSKNKSAVKALYLLAFTPNSKLFSSDYPYVPAWQYFWQLYL
ncbi:MAG: hypothetical protein HKUEN01_34640 [Candidatus Kuenenia stuttgartiensis]|nr:MAG: hypothetical protein HKUEN01_34640 [Candidatus Kuenenia stuttgartiensis]